VLLAAISLGDTAGHLQALSSAELGERTPPPFVAPQAVNSRTPNVTFSFYLLIVFSHIPELRFGFATIIMAESSSTSPQKISETNSSALSEGDEAYAQKSRVPVRRDLRNIVLIVFSI
jgi:hypothetical protein